jgi:hypothetical protein
LQGEGVFLRSSKKYTLDELVIRGQYAFCSQTNHPLHRAYEQAIVSSVRYLGSKYGLSIRPYQILEAHIEGKDKGYPIAFQNRYRRLMQAILLPMITRMRYRYNHNIDDNIPLFDDGNHGLVSNRCYGYELCDAGLPEDFEHSTKFYREIKSGSTQFKVIRNTKFSSAHGWNLVNTPEKFISFIHDVILDTAAHLKKEDAGNEALWDSVSQKMCETVSQKSCLEKLVTKMFEKSKKNHEKNPFTNEATPWKLKIGGDFDMVQQTFFGFVDSPSKMKEFNGNQREVLAKCITWIRNQPEDLKQEFEDPRSQLLITSPCHAFLLTPNEPSFRAAWESDLPAIEYIENVVINPGLEIASSTISLKTKRAIVDYVASNAWVQREHERHDFERQQLTEVSKQKFDELLSQEILEKISPEEFLNKIFEIVIHSRTADTRLRSRNHEWERKCKLALKNKMNKLYVKRGDWKDELINFARNRVDSIALSNTEIKRFNKIIQSKMVVDVSITDFRMSVLEAAYDCHCRDLALNDNEWKDFFCEQIDTKLFELLPQRQQKLLIQSGMITHDPNWKLEMHDFRTLWMVNPGSGELEMCNYLPDLKRVSFRCQKEWFPQVLGEKRGWTFPDNYIAWNNEPLFNVKKLMEI